MYSRFRVLVDAPLAAICLVLVSPVLIVAALFVKVDGGPIFFFQERVGKNGKIFKVFKLRTMVVDAEKMLDENGRPVGQRITKIGSFLRKSSIDELPQLLNIVIGDMAIVGPRPILPRMVPYMNDFERKRFNLRPGVTGLAQARGRNFIKWSDRFRYDVFYCDHQSFGLDVKIVLETVRMLVGGKGVAIDINADQVDNVTTRKING